MIERIAEALQFAHERGVIHRDIKPENIMLATTAKCCRYRKSNSSVNLTRTPTIAHKCHGLVRIQVAACAETVPIPEAHPSNSNRRNASRFPVLRTAPHAASCFALGRATFQVTFSGILGALRAILRGIAGAHVPSRTREPKLVAASGV